MMENFKDDPLIPKSSFTVTVSNTHSSSRWNVPTKVTVEVKKLKLE